MKTRIKFSKEGNLRFVGHLDMMRYFQKANRRAELPVAYSEGFHPHQIMSFAAPLGMGLEGKAEYFDLRITEEGAAGLHSEEAKALLNREMAEGVKILSFLKLPDDSPNCMSIVHAADYEIFFRASATEDLIAGQFSDGAAYRALSEAERELLCAAIDSLLSQSEITVEKTGKKGKLRELDIRPMIHSLRLEDNRLCCTVAQGSEANLKPELLLSALFASEEGRSFASLPRRVVRTELYDSEMRTLESYGEIF